MALAEGTTRESSPGQKRRRARLEGKDRDVPEGGWGWFIVVALAMNKLVSFGFLPLFAIIFKSVITSDSTYEGSAATFLVGLFFLVDELCGVFFPALHRRFSLRTTSFLGGVIFTLGSIASMFVVTVPQLAVTYSIIQGTGYGLMLSSSTNAFNQYFRERSTTAMATAQFATSVLSLGLPHGVQAALDAGGERAARALVVALAVGAAAAQLLVRGLPRPSADAQQPLKESEEPNIVDGQLPQKSTCSVKEPFKRRIRHCALGVWRHLGFSQRPLRAAAVWGPSVGLAVVHTGDTNFFALLPLHLRKVGFDKSEVTQAITAANIGDAVGRLALIVLGLWLRRVNRHIFAVSSISTSICVLGISWLTSWEAVLSFSALLGMFRGMLYVTFFVVIMEIVQPTLFPSAMALFFFFVFFSSLTISPLIGLVRDVSGSYPASFCLVAALCALFPVAWPAHALWRRFTREQRERKGSPISQRTDAYQQVSDANV